MLEILISREKEERKIALLENGKLLEYYVDEENSIMKEGNIYIGIVKDIVKGMQSAFVDIGTEKNSFIHLKDILDKIDESKENINPKIDISDIIKTGQKLLVQVKKDSNLQKGARVSTHINLPSKYIALMPNTDIVTISQKITDSKEKERLVKLVKENLSKGNGAIIRTSAIGKEQEIIEDIKNIEAKWEKIEISFKNDKGNKPKLIAKSENIVEKMLIDLPENSIQKITINNKKDYEKMLEFKEKKSYFKTWIFYSRIWVSAIKKDEGSNRDIGTPSGTYDCLSEWWFQCDFDSGEWTCEYCWLQGEECKAYYWGRLFCFENFVIIYYKYHWWCPYVCQRIFKDIWCG
mgnify:CR=1 FL=1